MNSIFQATIELKELYFFGKTGLYTIIFSKSMQDNFGNPNCCKVGQPTQELRKKVDETIKLKGGQRLPNLQIVDIFDTFIIKD
jgi:hypothetical protein